MYAIRSYYASKKVCYELNRKYANTYLNYNSYNLNYIDSIEEKYDLVLLVDSLYFVADINSTILNLFKILSPNGKIIVFFSEYEFKHVEEKPITDKNTVLGKVLINNRIKYEAFDVTNNEYKYWSDALQIGAEYCKSVITSYSIHYTKLYEFSILTGSGAHARKARKIH